ncbi:uncharacterized protein [Cherax quadricarinatus]|uniref:uncharacterized protein isoform X2 n=1 Tax=Cherax quadricarinatus TaxID=27406 RepID=UPI00387E8BB9
MTINKEYTADLTEVVRVEAVLNKSVSFTVCRLFTLDRQTFLTVVNFVATYLIITLQFTASEKPQVVAFKNNTRTTC